MEKETTSTTPQTREEILAASLDARVQEVMHYQINIDNYAIALEEIGNLPLDERAELSVFANQLRELLASEKLEQKKAQVMLNVIKRQVG
jgi:phytoene/squalene synthetase